jgi:hypothetical protein
VLLVLQEVPLFECLWMVWILWYILCLFGELDGFMHSSYIVAYMSVLI